MTKDIVAIPTCAAEESVTRSCAVYVHPGSSEYGCNIACDMLLMTVQLAPVEVNDHSKEIVDARVTGVAWPVSINISSTLYI